MPFKPSTSWGSLSNGVFAPYDKRFNAHDNTFLLPLFDELNSLRSGVTPSGRRASAGVPTNISGVSTPGITVTSTVVTIESGYAGTTFNNYDCGKRLVRIETPLVSMSDCILGALQIRFAGSLDTLSWNTFDADGPYARIHTGDLRKMVQGPVRLIESNRFLNAPSDIITSGGTLLAGGLVIRGNYFGPPWNLVEDPLPWNAGRTYSQVDAVLNPTGTMFRSLIDGNIGNAPPTGTTGNSFWENYTSSGNGPHTDAIAITAAPGDGVLVERNLFDWTRNLDNALGFGVRFVSGLNDWFRLDRGNDLAEAALKIVNAVTVRENLAWFGQDTGSSPAEIAPRVATNFNGPVSFIRNFMRPNSGGNYIAGRQHVAEWTNNIDAFTNDIIP